MIWLDLPLATTMILFIVLSWLYAWGLNRWFIHRFRWDLASVVGIMTVVCITYTFIWEVRGIPTNEQAVWDLFLVFSSALPGMMYVAKKLDEERKKILLNLRKRELDKILD